jgi:hypothetical protein
VGAQLADAAVDQDGNAIGIARGGNAVGDEKGGSALHLRPQAVEDLVFGIGVYAGQGVVEDQDFGVAQDGAGDGGALLLASGEGHPALTDYGAEAGGEFEDFCGDVGGARGGFYIRLIGLWRAKRDVASDGGVSWGTKPMAWRRVCRG